MNNEQLHQEKMAKKKAIVDTISDVQDIQHAFRKGVKAQAGIEW